MPGQNIQDNGNIRLFPEVVILVASNIPFIKLSAENQSYENKRIIFKDDSNQSVVDFYNQSIEIYKKDNVIFIFLDDYHWFAHNNVITDVMNSFMLLKFQPVAIYTDTIRIEKNYEVKEYLPSFNAEKFSLGQIGLNNTIFLNSKYIPNNPFNNSLGFLYFLFLIRQLSQSSMLVHYADHCFYNELNQQLAEKDIALINGQR